MDRDSFLIAFIAHHVDVRTTREKAGSETFVPHETLPLGHLGLVDGLVPYLGKFALHNTKAARAPVVVNRSVGTGRPDDGPDADVAATEKQMARVSTWCGIEAHILEKVWSGDQVVQRLAGRIEVLLRERIRCFD